MALPKRLRNDSEQRRKTTICIPYKKNRSEALRRILAKQNIQVAFKPSKTIGDLLSHPKDPLEHSEQSGVVYHIPCKDCGNAYVGETGRYCGQRKKEHMADLKLGNISRSAVAEHAIINDHRIDWDQCRVLCKENNLHKRKKLESWEIHKLPASINRDKGNLNVLLHS